MTALADAERTSEAGGRSRHPILLVYRAMLAFFRVDALQRLTGEKITDPQAADVEAKARERFEALLVQFLTTHRPTCMPSFSSSSYKKRLLVSACETVFIFGAVEAWSSNACILACHAVGRRHRLRRHPGGGSFPGGRQRPRRQRRRGALLARPASGRCGRQQPVSSQVMAVDPCVQ